MSIGAEAEAIALFQQDLARCGRVLFRKLCGQGKTRDGRKTAPDLIAPLHMLFVEILLFRVR